MTIELALQTAIAQHQAGQLAAAEEIYRQILAAQPDHADALHLLGAAALMSGRNEQAFDLIARAAALSPGNPNYESNLGEACRRLGRLDEAIAHLQRALALQPSHADALNNLGSAFAEKEQWEEAIACFQRSAALRPGDIGALNNLGLAFIKQRRTEEAVAWYRRVVTLAPHSVEAHIHLADALVKSRQWDEAMACSRRALVLQPDSVSALGNLGLALLAKDRRDEAIACGERALALEPNSPEALTLLAITFIEDAQHGRALEFSDRALAVNPNFAAARWARAQILLRFGRFEEGWREYEWRWRTLPLSNYRRRFPVPHWDGTPAPGQTILAHAEQGYGDALQFLRYVLLLRKHAGVGRVLVECGRPLTRLIAATLGEGAEVFPRETWDGSELPHFDLHIPWHSLPLALGLFAPETMVAGPYLRADPKLRARYRERFGTMKPFHVGLAWAGNADHPWDRHRSIAPDKFLPLLRLPGVNFYSLQVESRNGTPEVLMEAGLIDLTADITDFADSAALLAELDLVISIDSAAAHLAGALGRPVWTLLPFVADWRWGLEREETPWYPTMRLFRQSARGDWDSLLRRVEKRLREEVAANSDRRPEHARDSG